ncbi:MAG: class I SAM-dependent methyltransferase [Acidobacteria bacterium]|nr:class I SAM-dependent methyltransferase [Acidobacteriota bacterium]
MLKHPRLLELLGPPDCPDSAHLSFSGNQLFGAGWPVPVIDGIPDFVTFAPPVTRTLTYTLPIDDHPSPEVLQTPPHGFSVPVWFQENDRVYEFFLRHHKGVLVDVGSGPGNRSTYEGLGYDYVASDISFNSRQRINKEEADVDLVADSHRLPLRSGCAEAVISTAVLEHVYCPPIVVGEVRRILKPGGLFYGNCSFLEAEHYDSQYHHTHLGLYRLLTHAGLKVLYIFPGVSLWELHSGSIYFSLPGAELLGRLHRILYLSLVKLVGSESPEKRLLRHAAVLNFIATKE